MAEAEQREAPQTWLRWLSLPGNPPSTAGLHRCAESPLNGA